MLVTSRSIDIDIDRRRVWTNIGYCAECEPPARMSCLVDEYIENAHQLIEPSHSYVIKNVDSVHGSVAIIDDSIVFESEVIARLLERCCMVAVFLVTIGRHLEETVGRLAEDGLILQASVLDSIGSEAVERVADYVQDMSREMARADGFVISNRFSPGYCDWDVSQQKMVFRAVDADSIGVHLTEQCLMMPRKSISGIIGMGPSQGNVESYNPCITCDEDDCLGRR